MESELRRNRRMEALFGNDKRQILIVEDEEINRMILGNMLENQYAVSYAADGEEALEYIKEHHESISAVLLDLIMPKMDGFTLLRMLKDNPATKRIPILVMTGQKEAEVPSLLEGANDFIAKPYDMPEVIRARISNAIRLSEDRRLIETAERDALTGLYARDFFYQYCEQMDRNVQGEKDAVAIDIDHFKLVNGLYGKEFGDKVLITIAETLLDVADHNGGIVGRANADTFLLYQPHQDDYGSFAAYLNKEVNSRLENAHIHLRVGVYECVDQNIAVISRFDRARIACDRAKDNYSLSFERYDESFHKQQLESQKYIAAMDDAMKEQEFVIYYQPKYDMTGDAPKLGGAEALVRWNSKSEGLISPGKFIPLFEQNGLIYRLDLYIWNEVARQVKEWKQKYRFDFPVSVNVSRIDLFSPHLLQEILGIISRNDLSYRDIALEITESACATDTETVLAVVRSLRDYGFEIEMDDFGSGYSSLNMLSKMPINVLKMDMKFFQRSAGNDELMDAMVRLIIDFAKVMKVPVVAEGVEDKEQADYLKEIGCNMIQGYYFGRPMPAEDFEKLLKGMD
ncbi:MAG: EAL domain-containing protein [Succiniclasticum sp.]|uniref:putative bifunctional diguanylate cyclase/phosphodiesterase n=1 Tax=Succiniclasticum sp. TaxID=2775030 RepID=UPI002A91F63F|nr:EAL domain-containing protein [Succiniclasticum sp.]MDY6290606.1 EAL domain-containing protein [Succiniclasticum sp.]